jgi:hypothetical protein
VNAERVAVGVRVPVAVGERVRVTVPVAVAVGDSALAPRGSEATSSNASVTAASDTERPHRAPQLLPWRGALADWSTCSMS